MRKRFKLINGQNEPLNKSIGVVSRTSRTRVRDGLEIGDVGFGPLDAGHCSIQRLSLPVRPARRETVVVEVLRPTWYL